MTIHIIPDIPFKQCSCKDLCVHPAAIGGGWLPATLDYFYSDKTALCGQSYRCKECAKQTARNYHEAHKEERRNLRKANPEKYREAGKRTREKHPDTSRRWREANAEAFDEMRRNWLAKHPEHAAEYYAANKSRLLEKQKLYYQANTEARKAASREYYQAHKSQIYEVTRRYQSTHREQHRNANARYYKKHRLEKAIYAREWQHKNADRNRITKRLNENRRRAVKYSLPADFTPSDWQHALDYFNHSCAVCGKREDFWTILAADHWIPLTKGGGTTRTNMIPLCHARKGVPAGEACCNNSKYNAEPLAWLTERFGKRKAKVIMARIQAYFDSLT